MLGVVFDVIQLFVILMGLSEAAHHRLPNFCDAAVELIEADLTSIVRIEGVTDDVQVVNLPFVGFVAPTGVGEVVRVKAFAKDLPSSALVLLRLRIASILK